MAVAFGFHPPIGPTAAFFGRDMIIMKMMLRATSYINLWTQCRLKTKIAEGIAAIVLVAGGIVFISAKAGANDHHGRQRYNWDGGYYRAPPVVYGSAYGTTYYGTPSYYLPPVVYYPPVEFSIIIR